MAQKGSSRVGDPASGRGPWYRSAVGQFSCVLAFLRDIVPSLITRGCCAEWTSLQARREAMGAAAREFTTEGTESTEEGLMEKDPFTAELIGCAIEVHRALGPGLLESTYKSGTKGC